MENFNEKLVMSGGFLVRKAIYLIQFGLMCLRGFYTMVNRFFQRIAGTNDTGPALVALAAAYKFINPFTIVYKAASTLLAATAHAGGGWFLAGIPLVVFVVWTQTGVGVAYEAAVAAGRTAPPERETGEGMVPDSIPFGEATAKRLEQEQDVFFRAQRQVDDNIKEFVRTVNDQDWSKARAKLPADFRTICAAVHVALSPEEFMQLFYRDQTYMSRLADRLDSMFVSIPQRFFASLKPSLTLDDVFDSRGEVRKPGEICVAVYLRLETEHRPLFMQFMENFVPSVQS
jgi:hypothetical protein